MDTVFDIRKFDDYKEDNRLEVKSAKGGLPNSLWESYSALANSNGGVILLGVQERSDGSIFTTGLKDVRKVKKSFWDTINNRTKVSVNLLMDDDVRAFDINGDVVMAIFIPRAKREQRPIYINNDIWNGTYRRNWEGDYHCSALEIRAMLRDEPEETADMAVLEDFSIKDLNDETVQGYRNYHAVVRPGHVWEKLTKEEYLEKIGALGKVKGSEEFHPTAAGLLMFGEEYRIVRHFPEFFLDYREVLDPTIRWTDRIQSSSGDWTGNLFDFFFRVYNKLIRDLKKPFALDGVTRIEDTPVHKAIREALANCIVNTDFYLPRGVVILKERDQIVFQNPGSIRTGKTQMLRGGISDPRNKAIMKMLNMISIGERAGSGVPDIYSVWEDNGWQEPAIEETYGPDRTVLTLSFRKKATIKNDDKKATIKSGDKKVTAKKKALQDKIREFLRSNGESKTIIIAEAIGMKTTRTKELIHEMPDIEALGNNRNRTYRLKPYILSIDAKETEK